MRLQSLKVVAVLEWIPFVLIALFGVYVCACMLWAFIHAEDLQTQKEKQIKKRKRKKYDLLR